eukprot:1159212-Pelagomonas_calceolata.AAC.1
MEEETEYEQLRAQNIARNRQLLEQLQIPEAANALQQQVREEEQDGRWSDADEDAHLSPLATQHKQRRLSARSAASQAREKMRQLQKGGDG